MRRVLCVLLIILLLTGCSAPAEVWRPKCRLVLVEGQGFRAEQYALTVEPGQNASFSLTPEVGYQFETVDYPDYTIQTQGERQILTLRNVRYSVSVTVTYVPNAVTIRYVGNGGLTAAGEPEAVLPAITTHLRSNTSLGTDLFTWEGYTLYGWNTAPDGTGESVGLGSRVLCQEETVLYAQWAAWTPAECFTTEENETGLTLTGYSGTGEVLCVPARIGGRTVTRIGSGAFAGADCATVILPDTLERIEAGAFENGAVRVLYLSDSLEFVHGEAFAGCGQLQTLRINAATAPRYSGTYYDTFQDKLDRLILLRGERKLVLYSGSSARFGYDSRAISKAMPEYQVVNMGVFAYSNVLPQLRMLEALMEPGDLLLHGPEFDATAFQFCGTDALDAAFFAMMESNYDAVALLDIRQYSQVFSAFTEYLALRRDMAKKNYQISPRDFDEDGNPALTPSYNEYGDYVFYRANAESEEPVYGDPIAYTVAAFPEETMLEPMNRVYREFQDRGVLVLFTYAPRNGLALSEDSTPEERARLDAWLREKLCVPVISDIEESLYSGFYLYGTDNHLSTEGVDIRTERILRDLKTYFEEQEGEGE